MRRQFLKIQKLSLLEMVRILFFIDIGHVTREEKYEWDMAKVCVRNFNIERGSE